MASEPSLLQNLDLDQLAPARVWTALPVGVRAEAGRALYVQSAADAAVRRQADAAIAKALRFREASVRKLPPDRKGGYLARAIHPDDTLAASLLQALHLEARRPMLGQFLDALGIEHDDGSIRSETSPPPPAPEALRKAVAAIDAGHPRDQVDLYLVTLVTMEPDVWGGLRPLLEERRGA